MASAATREHRVSTSIPVTLGTSRGQYRASILDATSRGLLVSSSNAPLRGEIVEIFCGDDVLVGQVRWQRDDRFGVLLNERINVQTLVRGLRAPLSVKAQNRIEAERAAAYEYEEARRLRPFDIVFLAIALMVCLSFLSIAFSKWF